jgi:hypothetical protein
MERPVIWLTGSTRVFRTYFAPRQDRATPDRRFTQKPGDIVTIATTFWGTCQNGATAHGMTGKAIQSHTFDAKPGPEGSVIERFAYVVRKTPDCWEMDQF